LNDCVGDLSELCTTVQTIKGCCVAISRRNVSKWSKLFNP